MPAILRIFVYQTDASLSVIGSAESYGQCATVPRMSRTERLEQYVLVTVLVIKPV